MSGMDNQKALDLLEQVVAEKGDGYVYEREPSGCQYATYADIEQTEPIAPSCIVGHWAVKAGVPLAELRGHEGRAADQVVTVLVPDIESTDIARALVRAQMVQDVLGRTWGEALVAAKEVLCAPDTDG